MECSSPTDVTTAQNASALNENSTQSLTDTTGAATNASKSDEKAMQSLIEAVKRRRRSSLFPAPPAAGAGSPAAKGGGGALPDRSTRRSIGGARRASVTRRSLCYGPPPPLLSLQDAVERIQSSSGSDAGRLSQMLDLSLRTTITQLCQHHHHPHLPSLKSVVTLNSEQISEEVTETLAAQGTSLQDLLASCCAGTAKDETKKFGPNEQKNSLNSEKNEPKNSNCDKKQNSEKDEPKNSDHNEKQNSLNSRPLQPSIDNETNITSDKTLLSKKEITLHERTVEKNKENSEALHKTENNKLGNEDGRGETVKQNENDMEIEHKRRLIAEYGEKTAVLRTEYKAWKLLGKQRREDNAAAVRDYKESRMGKKRIGEEQLTQLSAPQQELLAGAPDYARHLTTLASMADVALLALARTEQHVARISAHRQLLRAAADSAYCVADSAMLNGDETTVRCLLFDLPEE